MADTSEEPGTSRPVMPCLPPGGLFEIVFSFDTTGSMSSVADEVKGRLQDMIQRLQADIPGIRMGVIAHGDYCDKDIFYLEKHIDFSNNIVELCDFLNGVEGTGGGDPEECYEYVLRLTSQFSWTPGSQRALVVIGDATPHEPEYELNVDNLDWRKEAEQLADMGIKVYAVQAFENADSTAFFQELVEKTAGHHVKLGEFSHICDFIMAICYREKGEDFLMDYEAEVRAREGRKKLANDLEGMFGVLRRGDSSVSNKSALAKSPSLVSSISAVSSVSKLSSTHSSMASNTKIRHRISKRLKPRCRSRLPVSSCSSRSRSRSGSPPGSRSRSRSRSRSSSASSVGRNARIRAISPLTCSTGVSMMSTAKAKRGRVTNKLDKGAAGSVRDQHSDVKLRHTVPDTKFILKQNGLAKRWSAWKLAISPDIPKSQRNWVKRDKGHKVNGFKPSTGWRRRTLFPKETGKTRVLYEVAIQQKRGGRMKVMFSKWGIIGANPENWEHRILGKRPLRQFVNGVLDLNCKVYVRRFVLRGLGKNQRQTLRQYRRQYRYAWSMDGK